MFTKLIDFFIPDFYSDDKETLRKSRLAVGVYIIVTLFSFSYSVINIVISFEGGLLSQAPLMFISILCLLMFKKGISEKVVAFIFFTSAILSISTAIYYTGGFNSFIIPWLATTPIVALLVSGKKMGIYTLTGQLAMLSVFYLLEITGVPQPAGSLTEPAVSYVLSTYSGLILIFYAVAIVFENGRMNAMSLLTDKNEDLQEAIEKIKSTQEQLVQQEKLASLGQLTAGIAHEIKNPLNFMNNFSEVSIEMVDEVREEVGSSPDSNLILEILDDIEANLRKIHEHGSRANGIVMSMLQHSRGGDGSMDPTPLNHLINEYVKLAFHGMRAGNDPINVDIQLELDDQVGEVPLVAEDFSRVILNICNNAFDAMREKLNIEEYKPKLVIRTQRESSEIILEIEDNGPGIPHEIKEKILQPFFTTKKGTQGTGLGLSITNDIIKAHGGKLAIETVETGTRFIITLSV
ncbi:MAG: GHKL domain-containing protein [Balneolaceae bacterium]|nr:GHKL domain-containing protein [Balneolaceae bacterium]